MAGWYCNKPGTVGDGARFSSFDHAFHAFYFLLTRCQICVCYERKKITAAVDVQYSFLQRMQLNTLSRLKG